MPPALRAQYQRVKGELRLAEAQADLGEHNVRRLTAERDAQKMLRGSLPEFKLPYFLNKDQLSLLTSRFPRTTFHVAQDNAHDHPLAHTENMIATVKAHRMVAAGQTLIDVYGDPKRCTDFNRAQARSNNPKRAYAYVGLFSEKDYLRSLKWGPSHDNNGLVYVEHNQGIIEDLDVREDGLHQLTADVIPGNQLTWFCRNTMYYLDDDTIAKMLRPAGSRMLSIVHRHMNNQGSLFGGECTYGKIAGCVEQVNVLTGERYVHRDLSFLWDSTSKVVRTASGAYTWTFTMVSVDTWIIELCGVPAHLDERFRARSSVVGPVTASSEMNDHALVPTRFPHPALAALPSAKCKMVHGVPVISFDGGLLPECKVTCPPLYEFLAANMVGKPRDEERLADLFSLARSHVVNGQEFPGKRNFSVAHQDIATHVLLAFVSGLETEVNLLRAVEAYRVSAREHSALSAGSALVVPSLAAPESSLRTAASILKRVNHARKQKDTFDGILSALE